MNKNCGVAEILCHIQWRIKDKYKLKGIVTEVSRPRVSPVSADIPVGTLAVGSFGADLGEGDYMLDSMFSVEECNVNKPFVWRKVHVVRKTCLGINIQVYKWRPASVYIQC